MAGVQNTREQKFKDWVLSTMVEMEPPQFMAMKAALPDPDMYPPGCKPLTKEQVDPQKKRELMELITNTFPNVDQSKIIVENVFMKIGVKGKFKAK